MTIIPFKHTDRVQTDQMADTEAASSIPPWPVDFGQRDAPANDDHRPHLDDSAEMLGRLIVYAGIFIAAIGGVAAMVWTR